MRPEGFAALTGFQLLLPTPAPYSDWGSKLARVISAVSLHFVRCRVTVDSIQAFGAAVRRVEMFGHTSGLIQNGGIILSTVSHTLELR